MTAGPLRVLGGTNVVEGEGEGVAVAVGVTGTELTLFN